MGRVRWAREVIGPKLRLENERIKPFGQLNPEHYVRTEWWKIRPGASPKLKLGGYVPSESFCIRTAISLSFPFTSAL
jgi:hypothetical protein